MAMAATEIDRNGDVAGLEFKSSPNVSMDGSQEDHSQALDSFDNDTSALTMETSTCASSTASLHDNEVESDNDLEELIEIDENSVPSVIEEICPVDAPCVQCGIEQPCSFRFTDSGETLYVCNEPCIKAYQAEYPGKYTVTRKKYLIEEITPKTSLCSECEEKKTCYFYYNFHGEDTFYCSLNCLEDMMADEKDKYAFKRNSVTICIDQIRQKEGQCLICEQVKPCEFSLIRYGEPRFLCERNCIKILNGRERGRYYIKKLRVTKPAASNAIDKNLDDGYKIQEKTAAMLQCEEFIHRRCSQCTLILMIDENVLAWEAMDFCDELCLERFQNGIGSRCAKCNNLVQHTSLGKYCVRFGYDIRQFCDSSCLEEFKIGLKICCYCQRDISTSTQVFLAPVGDNGQFKDFCAQSCVEKFDQMSKNPVPQPVWAKCAVCSLEKATTIEMEVTETTSQRICSEPCFAAYKFVNNILPDQCKWCKKYFERKSTKSFTTYDDSNPNCFCSQSCMTIHINLTKFIVSCNRCKSKKYNFDIIRRVDNGQAVMMCSLNCLSLYQESGNALSSSKFNQHPETASGPSRFVFGEEEEAGPSTLRDNLALVRKRRVEEKRRIDRLQPEARREFEQKRAMKERGLFLMPDAPTKRSRKASPDRVECPLKKGTPREPPPRILQRWELVNSTERLTPPTPTQPPTSPTPTPPPPPSPTPTPPPPPSPTPTLPPPPSPTPTLSPLPSPIPTFSLSTGIRSVTHEKAESLVLMPVDVEIIELTPDSSAISSPQPQSSTVHTPARAGSRRRLFENDDNVDSRVPGPTEGSDLDEDDIIVNPQNRAMMDAGVDEAFFELDEAEDQAIRELSRDGASGQDVTNFEWLQDVSTFTGSKEQFLGPSGPTFLVNGETPLTILQRIWDVELMSLIVQKTNKYARDVLRQGASPQNRMARWQDTSVDEMWVFFAVLMVQSLAPQPVEREYWYPMLDILKMPKLAKVMPFNRFILIKKCLHFVDNAQIVGTSNVDKRFAKIKPLIDALRGKFKCLYMPAQEIALDESLLLWKGRLSFAQLIATKKARVGIKSYELCESKTGYLWDMRVYTGNNNSKPRESEAENEPQSATAKIVFDLVRPLLGRGHVLVMDNFYNAPLLSRLLKRQKTDTMGTLRLNREFVPNSLKVAKSQMRQGEVAFSQTSDMTIVVWRDVNLVSLISTFHKVEVGGKEKHGRYFYKPQVVLDYNQSMGGVDKKDQLLSAFPMERSRNSVWYKKLFRRLLNVSIINAWIIFCHHNTTMPARRYRQVLVEEILLKHKIGWAPSGSVTVVSRTPVKRLVENGHYPKRSQSRFNRCKWCYTHSRTSRTAYHCDVCDVPLCIDPCFKDFHTKPE